MGFQPEEDFHEDFKKVQPSEQESMVSLRVRTLDQLANAVVKCEDVDPDVFLEAEILTDFWPKVKERLYADAGNLKFSNVMLDVFSMSLKDDQCVNMSPFNLMSVAEISQVVSCLCHDASLVELNLSNHLRLSKEEIRMILEKAGSSLSILYVRGDGAISLNEIIDLSFQGKVYHDQLLGRLFYFGGFFGGPMPLLKFRAEHPVVHLAWVGYIP